MLRFFRISLILVFLFISCIYTFSGGFPSKLRNVYIESFENRTKRQDITLSVQNFFIEQVQRDGRLNIVSKGRCNMLIIPSILNFDKRATEFTETGEVTVYSVRIKAKILTKVVGDSLSYLKDSVFYGQGIYSAVSEEEDIGIERAVIDLTNNFLNKLFEARM